MLRLRRFVRARPRLHAWWRRLLALRRARPPHPPTPEAIEDAAGAAPPEGGASHWDSLVTRVESKELKGWLDWDLIEEEHIRPQVSGDRSVYYIEHFLRTHVPDRPVERALSLGCGGGNLERSLIDAGAAHLIDAVDASPASIRLARRLAAEHPGGERIRYEVQDVNRIRLEPGVYDFVVAKMALHHFEALERVFEEVRRALKPGGVFMFNEFVGPSRFQWTDLQLELGNRLLALLPQKNRWSEHGGAPLERLLRPTVEDMIAMDPSEAVRSAEILPVLERSFEIVERKDYGGTLLHDLLTHVMASFDLEDERELSILRLIFLFERTLVEHGVLSSDFTYVVARPR